jgi:hypothetical protein
VAGLTGHAGRQWPFRLAKLLREGERSGDLRPGLDPLDVAMALGGLALIVGEQNQRSLVGSWTC